MSLTNCPDCRSLCFLKSTTCSACGKEFAAGALQRSEAQAERAFKIKYGTLYLALLLPTLAVLLFFLLTDYMKGTGVFKV